VRARRVGLARQWQGIASMEKLHRRKALSASSAFYDLDD
jgi:hypothetical protein